MSSLHQSVVNTILGEVALRTKNRKTLLSEPIDKESKLYNRVKPNFFFFFSETCARRGYKSCDMVSKGW